MNTTTAPTVPLGRRLTAVLDTGVHPATGAALLPGLNCGSCAYHVQRATSAGERTSCALVGKSRRHGPNLPPHTPACQQYAAAL
jgi:hypothetical protein